MVSIIPDFFYCAHKDIVKLAHKLVGHSLDSKIDVAVVTGGSSGLGKEIVSLLAICGVKVAVLDVSIPPQHEFVQGALYYHCDVSIPDDITVTKEKIKNELGIVSVLINNAGITNGKSLLELDYAEIHKTIQVNLLLSFYTTKVFLPDMMSQSRGYIVTIGSVLGNMSPARLSAYGASKAGLIALHESLTYELGPPLMNPHGIKTLLVCPGQMRTDLFCGVLTPCSFLAPELDPKYVAAIVVKALEQGRRGEIKLPFYGNFLPVLRAVPWPLTAAVRYLSGIDSSMLSFKESLSRIVIREVSENNSTTSIPSDS